MSETIQTVGDQSAELATSTPATRKIRSRYRDLNGRGNGSECYRLALDGDRLVWADRHSEAVIVSDDFPRCGLAAAFRASERRGATRVELPVGTLIVDIDHTVARGKKERPTYAAGVIVAEGDPTSTAAAAAGRCCISAFGRAAADTSTSCPSTERASSTRAREGGATMTHEQASNRVRRMADGVSRERLIEEFIGAKHGGNSVYGSLLSIQFGMPRQYAEGAVVETLARMLRREVQS